ncbi:hypothetical protein BH10BAC1_BH10BAC1_07510 [soil metagenome]
MLVFVLSTAVKLSSQTVLDPMLIISVGKYNPVIVDAPKINEKPTIVDSTKKLNVNGYNINNSRKVTTGYDVEPIEAAKMVGEPLTKLYNGLVKIGVGNYKTPYGEAWYNNLRSKEYSYGLRLKHLSSQTTLADYGFGGFSDNEISLYGKKFLKEHTLSGDFDYSRNVVHFYGYDTDLFNITDDDLTIQRFNYFGGSAELKSHYAKAERYNHDVKLNFYNLQDTYKSSESNFKASGYLQTAVLKEVLKVNASVDYYNYKTASDTTNNTIISINPNFIATGEKYRASIGVTGVIDVFVKSKFYFYPNIDLSYNIVDNIIVPYAGASGKLQKNSFKALSDENPFVLSDLTMNNSNYKYELFGGLKGTLSSTIAYNARVSYSSIDHLALFVTDTKDLLANRFDVIYDDAELLKISGEVAYQQREKLRISLRGEYFNYKMDLEQKAWYKPQMEFTLSANYNLKDKIVAKVDLYYMDSQFAKTFAIDSTSSTGEKVVAQELKGVFDANVGLEYRYTKKLGFFLNFTNIANFRYYRYNNYPTQRIGFMGGLSYSF